MIAEFVKENEVISELFTEDRAAALKALDDVWGKYLVHFINIYRKMKRLERRLQLYFHIERKDDALKR